MPFNIRTYFALLSFLFFIFQDYNYKIDKFSFAVKITPKSNNRNMKKVKLELKHTLKLFVLVVSKRQKARVHVITYRKMNKTSSVSASSRPLPLRHEFHDHSHLNLCQPISLQTITTLPKNAGHKPPRT